MGTGLRYPSRGSEMYTLAQSRTANPILWGDPVKVNGEGVDINNPVLKSRARKKTYNLPLLLGLIDVAKEKGDFDRVQEYWNAYHCQERFLESGGRLHTTYCKSRLCSTCNGIRKAQLLNRYYPELSKWKGAYLVTLTVVAQPERNLAKWIKGMYKAFNRIKERCNKRHKRGKGIKLIGVKSLECNFNPTRGTYNPHFHIIVPSREIAEVLVKEWLIQWTNKHTSRKGQHIRKVRDMNHDLIEVIKYGAKVFTEPDPNNKKSKVPRKIYVRAMDNIYAVMKGHRLFDRFGFNLPKEEPYLAQEEVLNDYKIWEFATSENDWVQKNTGETLTGFEPVRGLKMMLLDGMDKVLC